MASFRVSVPFAGEIQSVFKTVTDVFSYVDSSRAITPSTDEVTKLELPVTLGDFRLLLDGECTLVDRDFESHVALVSFTTKDRGGKGRINGNLRVEVVPENAHFDCTVNLLGMLARVELPLEEVVSREIVRIVAPLMENVDDTAEVLAPIVAEEIAPSPTGSKHVWVRILQFPAWLLTRPYFAVRAALTA